MALSEFGKKSILIIILIAIPHLGAMEEVFNEGPTVSQHVQADDEQTFAKSSFQLKRTRSMGLFDDFLVKPTANEKFVTDDTREKLNLPHKDPKLATGDVFFDHQSDDSMSSVESSATAANKVSLIPKHQLKKMQQRQQQKQKRLANARMQSASRMNSGGLHDDIELNEVKNAPKEHVDYLTHKWDEDEISKSWKYVVLRRTGFADSVRLENASWRTWAQTKNNLKTLPASLLNWDNRDNEITWLYGPVLRQHDSISSFNSPMLNHNNTSNNNNSSMEKLNLTNSATNTSNNTSNNNTNNNNNNNTNSNDDDNLKSILKKKTAFEHVISDASYSRLHNLLNQRESRMKSISPILEPQNSPTNSSENNVNTTSGALHPIKSSLKTSSLTAPFTAGNLVTHTKKIHFNPRVTQCMAIDPSDDEDAMKDDQDENHIHGGRHCVKIQPNTSYPKINPDDMDVDSNDDEDDGDDSMLSSEDDDDFMIMNNPINISHAPTQVNKKAEFSSIHTIVSLPATTLNLGLDDEQLDDLHGANGGNNTRGELKTNKGLNHYDYNSVYKNADIQMYDVPENIQMDVDSFVDLKVPATVTPIPNNNLSSSSLAGINSLASLNNLSRANSFHQQQQQPFFTSSQVSGGSFASVHHIEDSQFVISPSSHLEYSQHSVSSESGDDDDASSGDDGGFSFGSRTPSLSMGISSLDITHNKNLNQFVPGNQRRSSSDSPYHSQSHLVGISKAGSPGGSITTLNRNSSTQMSSTLAGISRSNSRNGSKGKGLFDLGQAVSAQLINEKQKSLSQTQMMSHVDQKGSPGSSVIGFGQPLKRPSSSGFLLNSDSNSDSETDSDTDMPDVNVNKSGFDLTQATNSCKNGSSLADVNARFIGSAAKNGKELSIISGFSLGDEDSEDDSDDDEMWFGRK